MRCVKCASLGVLIGITGMQTMAGPGPTTYYSFHSATITEIGTLGGTTSVGEDINNSGVIVGSATDALGFTHAFYFADGNLTDISIGARVLSSRATGINNSGAVVGTFGVPAESNGEFFELSQPFYWKAGTPFTPLEVLSGGPIPHAYAMAINDSGIIAGGASGQVSTTDGPCFNSVPVKWTSPTSAPTPFNCPGDYGAAADINTSGSVVGTNWFFPPTIFRYIGGANASVPLAPKIPGLIRESNGQALALNDHHNVVGHHMYSNPNSATPNSPVYRAFFWNGASTQSTLLGVLPGGRFSKAHDVNEQRMVVGMSDAYLDGIAYYQKAYIWHADFGLKQLPSLPLPQGNITPGACEALAINDRKASNLVQAVGYCTVSGNKRAVRWDIDVRKYTSGVTVTP